MGGVACTDSRTSHQSIENENNCLPEEIGPAIKFAFPGEAALGQDVATIGASDAFGVPRSVQHRQQELVEDWAIAAGTRHDHFG